MHLDPNPYTPGPGRRPPALTGRQGIIDGFDLVVARSKCGHTDRGLMLSGLRGVGKTALLNHLRIAVAEPADWVTISLEASSTRSGAASVRRQFGRELLTAVRRFSRRRRAEHVLHSLQEVIGSFTVSVGPVAISREAPPTSSDRADTEPSRSTYRPRLRSGPHARTPLQPLRSPRHGPIPTLGR